MELYKYCKKEHMEAMLERGAARIGTVYGWRQIHQEYGELVVDESEGFTEVGGNVVFWDHRFVPDFLVESSLINKSSPGNHHVEFKNSTFYTPDRYAFSAAMTYAEEDHQRWFEKENYDACYRIHSAESFFASLTEALGDRVKFLCFAPVHYYDKSAQNHEFKGAFHPALVKRSKFGSQFELRALWTPNSESGEIKLIDLPSTNANKYCSVHRLLS
jgi:hypothetical protein